MKEKTKKWLKITFFPFCIVICSVLFVIFLVKFLYKMYKDGKYYKKHGD